MACTHGAGEDMVTNRRKRITVLTMMCLTGAYMVVEAVVGLVTGSLALFGDSIHMLTDLASLVIGFIAIKLASRPRGSKFTYGFARAEPVAGLVNASLVVGITFFIIIESIERFIEKVVIEKPILMMSVAGVGLLVNIVGIIIFHGGHSHGHDHDHGHGHGHDHDHESCPIRSPKCQIEAYTPVPDIAAPVEDGSDEAVPRRRRKRRIDAESMAVHGIYLHILGDLLGSVVALGSGAFITFAPDSWTWKYYVDPICSLVIVVLIINASIPLFRDSIRILMQTAPSAAVVDGISADLARLDGAAGVHDLHVWRLTDKRVVASVHVVVNADTDPIAFCASVRGVFHAHGVHSVTIQPERPEFEYQTGVCYAAGGGCAHTAALCCPESAPAQPATPAADGASHTHSIQGHTPIIEPVEPEPAHVPEPQPIAVPTPASAHVTQLVPAYELREEQAPALELSPLPVSEQTAAPEPVPEPAPEPVIKPEPEPEPEPANQELIQEPLQQEQILEPQPVSESSVVSPFEEEQQDLSTSSGLPPHEELPSHDFI